MISVFLASCSLLKTEFVANWPTKIEDIKKIPWPEEATENELTFHIDYPILENSQIDKKMRDWWENIISQTKKEVQENWSSDAIPELHSSFKKYFWKWITSIVFDVSKIIWKGNPENFFKIFYIWQDWKELLAENILYFENDEKKEKFLNLLFEKVKDLEWTFKDEEIKENLKNIFPNTKFYFNWEKVTFIFEEYFIWPRSSWAFIVDFNFFEVKEFLNTEVFPELKAEAEELAEKLKEEKIQKEAEIIQKIEEKNLEQEKIVKENISEENSKKYVALTFDDGPSSKTTPLLLDILKENNVKATFFVLWKNVSHFPDILKREYEEWHEIANHTRDHPNLKNLSPENIKKQISATDKQIEETIWIVPTLVRPPYGSHGKWVDEYIWKTLVLWDVDSKDRKNRNVERNLASTLPDVKNWSIILYHDIHKPSVDTIDSLIKELKNRWYEFLTVSELLAKTQTWDISNLVCNSAYNCKNIE